MSIEWIRKELNNQYKDLVEDLCLISPKEATELKKSIQRNWAITRIARLTKIRITLVSGEVIDTDLEMFWWDDGTHSEALMIPGTTTQSLRYVFPNAIATFEIWRPSDAVLDQQYQIAKDLGIAELFDEA